MQLYSQRFELCHLKFRDDLLGFVDKITKSYKFSFSGLCGLFTETGLMGMLQVKDYESLHKFSSFSGIFADEPCGLRNNAFINSVFKEILTSGNSFSSFLKS